MVPTRLGCFLKMTLYVIKERQGSRPRDKVCVTVGQDGQCAEEGEGKWEETHWITSFIRWSDSRAGGYIVEDC